MLGKLLPPVTVVFGCVVLALGVYQQIDGARIQGRGEGYTRVDSLGGWLGDKA